MINKKNILKIIIGVALVIAIGLSIFFTVLYAPRSTRSFFEQNESILSISFYAITNPSPITIERFYLDVSKFDEFVTIAKENKYRKWTNFLAKKESPISSILYIIEYETFYIEFGDVNFGVFDKETNQPIESLKTYTILTKDNFAKLYSLFNAPDGIRPIGYNKARNEA